MSVSARPASKYAIGLSAANRFFQFLADAVVDFA
jgi:hypothetical protein